MAHDPKYRFDGDDRVFHRVGGYYLPTDEPVVLFRGKDVGTLVALAAYREFMEYVASHADSDHAREVARSHAVSISERMATIEQFQREHPERTGLGCHTCPPGVAPHDIRKHLAAVAKSAEEEQSQVRDRVRSNVTACIQHNLGNHL